MDFVKTFRKKNKNGLWTKKEKLENKRNEGKSEKLQQEGRRRDERGKRCRGKKKENIES